jgi:hypothetical protein
LGEKGVRNPARGRYILRMPRRPASHTQADIARVLRAARQVGAKSVEVKVGDTSVTISFDNDNEKLDRILAADSNHGRITL